MLVRAVAELGVERPLVLGHSYGGAVALAWATRHPEATAGLILLAAASNPWDTPLSTLTTASSPRPWVRPSPRRS